MSGEAPQRFAQGGPILGDGLPVDSLPVFRSMGCPGFWRPDAAKFLLEALTRGTRSPEGDEQ